MLKRFGALVAWFSGSLAGISAILYALGFVATKSADQVLGVGLDFASRDAFDYIARGSSVVMRTALVAIWTVLAVLAAASMVRWADARFGLGNRQSLGVARRWADTLAAPAAALSMLFLAIAGLAVCVLPALQTTGLLFAVPRPGPACDGGIAAAIQSQNRGELRDWFNIYALCLGLITGIGLSARARLADENRRGWLLLSWLAGMLAFVGAPIAYGALVVQISAPDVWINQAPGDGTSGMRLLSRSGDGVLVWLEDKRKVQWISASHIDKLTVGPERAIATAACSTASPLPNGG